MYAIWNDLLGYWHGGRLNSTLSPDKQTTIDYAKLIDKWYPMHRIRVFELNTDLSEKQQIYSTK